MLDQQVLHLMALFHQQLVPGRLLTLHSTNNQFSTQHCIQSITLVTHKLLTHKQQSTITCRSNDAIAVVQLHWTVISKVVIKHSHVVSILFRMRQISLYSQISLYTSLFQSILMSNLTERNHLQCGQVKDTTVSTSERQTSSESLSLYSIKSVVPSTQVIHTMDICHNISKSIRQVGHSCMAIACSPCQLKD